MTTGTVVTKGTRLSFLSPIGSPDTIRTVACATGISGLGGSRDQIDITCLTSDEREFAGGFSNPGQLTVPFNFIPNSASQQDLLALKDSGDTISWMIVFSDQAALPTTSSGGRLVSPGATTAEFLGYVSDVTFDIANNEIVRGTLVIQRSGTVDFDLPTAAQA